MRWKQQSGLTRISLARCKRKGWMALSMIWMMAAFLILLSGMALYLARSAAMNASKSQGIRAVYAAESGALWAVEALRHGKEPSQTHISLGNADAEVTLTWEGTSSKGKEGVIESVGKDTISGNERMVKLLLTKDSEGAVHIDQAGSTKWITRHEE